MMVSRTHVSVTSKTYKRAKQIKKEREAMGLICTMEDAVYYAKLEEKQNKEIVRGWGF